MAISDITVNFDDGSTKTFIEDTGTGDGGGDGGTTDPTPNPDAVSAPTVFDFGAVGDGSTDDSAALSAALQHAMDAQTMVHLPAGHVYHVANGVVATAQANITHRWGLFGGGRIHSSIDDGSDVIRLVNPSHSVRYMHLDGFEISSGGSNNDGAGIRLFADHNWSVNTLSNLVVNNTFDGIVIEGLFFETGVFAPHLFDIGNDAFVTKNLSRSDKPHNVSSISVYGINASQCGRFGVFAIGPDDNPYGAPQETTIHGGYIRECGAAGIRFKLGGYAHDVKLENNGDGADAMHVRAGGPCYFDRLRGETQGRTEWLVLGTGSGNHDIVMRDCVHRGGKLAKSGGSAFMYMDQCPGTIDMGTHRYIRTYRDTQEQNLS